MVRTAATVGNQAPCRRAGPIRRGEAHER
jgi:hypothetical protein